MKYAKSAQKIKSGSETFLKKNPEIAKALRLFDVAYERYKLATEQQGYFYTDVSTSLLRMESPRTTKAKSE